MHDWRRTNSERLYRSHSPHSLQSRVQGISSTNSHGGFLLRMNLPLLAEGAAGASDSGERVIRLIQQVETLNHELVEALVCLLIQ
jgi:hypothetical protein